MINKFKYPILVAILIGALGFYLPQKVESDKKDKVILNLVYNVLNSSHFSPQELDDDFSEEVYDEFIKNMDYNKRFLLEEDIKKLETYKKDIDNEVIAGDLTFFDEAYAIYQMRFEKAKSFYKQILAEPFDFTKKETIETDDEKIDFPKNEEELYERWRQYLKYRTLTRIEERMERQEKQAEKEATDELESDEDAEDDEPKTFAEIEKKAREDEMELHDDWFENLEDLEHIDWLGIYLNSITTTYDPHTQYFPPQRQEDFEISMTGQLQGIGAQLQQKGDYVTISKIITGSACWKQGDLEEGDKIVKVAQEDGTAVDMVGMSVRKAVKYIRGPKGTEVTLTVEKLDGSKQIIPIVRDIVNIEATFAKSAVIGEGDNKVGYIKLPKFYVDFYDESNRNCAEDVKNELIKLEKAGVKSVVLDLRNNGGGSLQGVVDMVGLFIDKGPVVQVKEPAKKPKILRDTDNGLVYDGPLVVMVNQYSASASEIFAAAIQDYKRGLVIGSKSTFGKGTVQNVLDMDRAVNYTYNDIKPLGALKLTIQKFYRINGGTTQLKGVEPDIVLPDNFSYIDYGEKEQLHALPYDEIPSAEYAEWTKGIDKYGSVISGSQDRIKNSPKFQLIDEYAKWLKNNKEDSKVSLVYEDFKKEQEDFREESKKYKDMRKTDDELVLTLTVEDEEAIAENDDKQKDNVKWFKGLSKDVYLHEAYAVAEEMK